MKKQNYFLKNLRKWLPGVVISLIAIYAITRVGTWEDVKTAFNAVRPINLIGAVVLTVVSLFTRAMTWRTLLENRPSLLKTFSIVNIGYFFNNIFPLRAGEVARAVFMGRSIGLSPFHVLSTIVIERAFDVAMAASLLLITLPLALGLEWAKPVAMISLAVVIGALAAMFFIARNTSAVMGWLEKTAGKWGWFKRLVLPQLESILNGFSVLTRPSQFFIGLFWIALSWVIWVFLYWIMLLPISPTSPLWHAAFVDSTLAMGVAIPSAPGSLGIFEATIVGALAILGISQGAALGYALLMHIFNYAITGVLGIISLIVEGRSFSSVFAAMDLNSAGEDVPEGGIATE